MYIQICLLRPFFYTHVYTVPSPCIIIPPRNSRAEPRAVAQDLGEAPPHRIFKSLKFLLVVNIVMLSAAVVTPSRSASSGSSSLLSHFFLPATHPFFPSSSSHHRICTSHSYSREATPVREKSPDADGRRLCSETRQVIPPTIYVQ